MGSVSRMFLSVHTQSCMLCVCVCGRGGLSGCVLKGVCVSVRGGGGLWGGLCEWGVVCVCGRGSVCVCV